MKIIKRKAKKEDIKFLENNKLDIILKGNLDEIPEESKIKELKEYINKEVNKYIEQYQILEIDNKMIGDFLITNYEDGKLIDEIYIVNEYRNKKIGKNILLDILKSYKKNIYLWVYKNNVIAINLYKNLNFNIIKETKTRYLMKLCK